MDGLLENPIKMDDLGVPLFLETSRCSMSKREMSIGCPPFPNWFHSRLMLIDGGCCLKCIKCFQV